MEDEIDIIEVGRNISLIPDFDELKEYVPPPFTDHLTPSSKQEKLFETSTKNLPASIIKSRMIINQNDGSIAQDNSDHEPNELPPTQQEELETIPAENTPL